jgi:hypothetical protein
MKGINNPGQALIPRGVASSWAPSGLYTVILRFSLVQAVCGGVHVESEITICQVHELLTEPDLESFWWNGWLVGEVLIFFTLG